MRRLVLVVLLGFGCSGERDWVVAGGASRRAAAPAPVDTAKQIATMEKKLADWPQLGRYRADECGAGSGGTG